MRLSFASLALAISPILAESTENGLATSLSALNVSMDSSPSRELLAFRDCLMAHNIKLKFGTPPYQQFRANRSTKCCRTCSDTRDRCLGYTWTNANGGTCYLYDDFTNVRAAIEVGADTCLTIPGDLFQLSNCDMPGNDLSNKRLPLGDCPAQCHASDGCKGFTWTNYEGGTCWFKRDIRECVVKQGAVSRVMMNQVASWFDGVDLP